jgi:hypothetical protein
VPFKKKVFARLGLFGGIRAVVLLYFYKGLWVLQLWVRQKIGMKRIAIVCADFFACGTIDYILECPRIFNLKISNKKEFKTKFRVASPCHSSLSLYVITSIYIAI